MIAIMTPNPAFERTRIGVAGMRVTASVCGRLRPRRSTRRWIALKMSTPQLKSNPFTGRWRLVEMEMWPQDYVDLEGPGHITFNTDAPQAARRLTRTLCGYNAIASTMLP
jgi:hypothetical protein